MPKAILLVHAGAGQIPENIPKDQEADCKDALNMALQAGYKILQNGGNSLDAIEAAIRIMEDFPLFNAGKGAVIANSGQCELDASIMDGKNKKAGAVANITIAKNPISVARAVMENTEYVLLSNLGANKFAQEYDLEIVESSYFYTAKNLEKLRKAQEDEANIMPTKLGTVGAVALDKEGNLAAGTSTGGRTNKHFGRIGDSAIIGAGTYADNETCAVSCTGYGEIFIRHVIAYDTAALIGYKGLTLEEATNEIIHSRLPKDSGGIIAIDKEGNYAMPYNTAGMLRGYITNTGESKTYIYD
jgi:L-asparaginase / beta-aspartyl-peptidase